MEGKYTTKLVSNGGIKLNFMVETALFWGIVGGELPTRDDFVLW